MKRPSKASSSTTDRSITSNWMQTPEGRFQRLSWWLPVTADPQAFGDGLSVTPSLSPEEKTTSSKGDC